MPIPDPETSEYVKISTATAATVHTTAAASTSCMTLRKTGCSGSPAWSLLLRGGRFRERSAKRGTTPIASSNPPITTVIAMLWTVSTTGSPQRTSVPGSATCRGAAAPP